jgi:hypothetical protein
MFNLPTEFADPRLRAAHAQALAMARTVFANHGEVRPLLLISTREGIGVSVPPMANDADKDRVVAIGHWLSQQPETQWCALLCEAWTLQLTHDMRDGQTPQQHAAAQGRLADRPDSTEAIIIWIWAGILHGCATYPYVLDAAGVKSIGPGHVLDPGQRGMEVYGRMVPGGGREGAVLQ